MSIPALILHKIKQFRFTIPSLILLAFASYRALTTGYSIQLTGICASVVPFICQFKNFPRAAGKVSAFKDALSSYLMNLILMVLYLAYMLVLTAVGKALVPGYVVNPCFSEMLALAVCANVVFISVLIPVCIDLKPMQRMMPGILLCNAQLAFMMLAGDYAAKAAPAGLIPYAGVFCALILLLTLCFMAVCFRETKKV